MRRRRWLLVAGLVGAGAAVSVSAALAGRDAGVRNLVLTGSSTVAPLAAEISVRYEASHPGVRVDVQTGGSSRGLADTRRGLNDVGMVSRALGPEEADLRAWPVARDGIALLVHRDNPVAELAPDEIRAIWRGEIDDWSRVGGAPGPITVVHKAEGRATLERFLQHFGLRNSRVEPDVIIGDNQQGIRTVAGNPGAVGYVSIGEAEVEAERGAPIRLLPLRGVPATTAEVGAGRYPLLRQLTLVTAGEPEDAVADFLAFSRSEAVHDLVRRQAFVPVARE